MLAGEGKQLLMAAVSALHAGKAVVEIAAIQTPINNLLKIRPEETILFLESPFTNIKKTIQNHLLRCDNNQCFPDDVSCIRRQVQV
jgi:hypothetical protein